MNQTIMNSLLGKCFLVVLCAIIVLSGCANANNSVQNPPSDNFYEEIESDPTVEEVPSFEDDNIDDTVAADNQNNDEATTSGNESTGGLGLVGNRIVNVRDNYEHIPAYIGMTGDIVNHDDSTLVRIPVQEGDTWYVWYEDELRYNAAQGGALRFENSAKEKTDYVDMGKLPRYKVNAESDILGVTISVPAGVSYMCINLRMLTLYDFRDTAIISKNTATLHWATFGDSIAEYNHTSSENWTVLTADALATHCYNFALGGSGYVRNGGFSQFFDSLPENVNVITFYGSFNDLSSGVPIGNADDTYVEGAENTLAAHMNHAYDYISSEYPNAQIIVIAPAPWASTNPENTSSAATKYVDVMQAICEARNIPFLDLYRTSGMTPWDSDYNNQYFYNGDGTHPNDEGQKILASKIIPFMQEIIN